MDFDSHTPRVGDAADAFMTGASAAGTTPAAEAGEKSAFLQTIEEIREKGLQAYAEEQQAKKLEELRKKILEAMGLTEERQINAWPPCR